MTEPDIDVSIDPGLSEPTTGPGHRLRQARERKGLDVTEVSDRLHLPARLVTAIEHDDYAELPGAVFVQGYLRNYARLVGEAADEIVNMFNDVRPREEYSPALRQFQRPMKASQVNSSHGLVKAVTWLMVLALLVLLAVWWRGYIKLPVPILGEEKTPVTPVESAPGLPLPHRPATPGESKVLQIPAPAATATTMPDEAAADDATSARRPQGTTAVPVVREEPVSDEVTGEVAIDDAAVAAGEMPEQGPSPAVADPAVADEEDPSPTVADSPAKDEIRLVFEAPCWVDIRDATGAKVLYGGIDAGEAFSLTGTPPYQVVLGDSGAVKILLGGRVYPTDGHSRGRVAKFVLDPAKALMAANGSEQ